MIRARAERIRIEALGLSGNPPPPRRNDLDDEIAFSAVRL
jgi:hypothetical protein